GNNPFSQHPRPPQSSMHPPTQIALHTTPFRSLRLQRRWSPSNVVYPLMNPPRQMQSLAFLFRAPASPSPRHLHLVKVHHASHLCRAREPPLDQPSAYPIPKGLNQPYSASHESPLFRLAHPIPRKSIRCPNALWLRSPTPAAQSLLYR